MKKNSLFLYLTMLGLAAVLQPATLIAQSKKDSAKIAQFTALVTNQEYTFKAQSVTPMAGRLRQLTTGYDLKVAKDVIISQLPYFGRAYSAPIGNSGSGIEFTAKDFEYISTPKKKGGWDINIKFKDAGDVKQMQLSIFDNGTSTLQVISNNRQSISFNGYVAASAKPK